jgi:hypothetical protein
VIAKRKGVLATEGLKEAWNKRTSRWTRTGYKASGAGRAGFWPQNPYPSRAPAVDSAVVYGRRLNLPREICRLSGNPD